MDKSESCSVIDAAGGDRKFAKLLGIDSDPGFAQRVNNWRRRGIPSDVVLANFDEIRRLQSLAAELAREASRKRPSSAARKSIGR
jgi:hypothetical protein